MSHSAPQCRSTRTAAFSATLAAAAIALTACGGDAAPSGPTSAPASASDGAESTSGEATAASPVSEEERVDPTRTTEVSAVTRASCSRTRPGSRCSTPSPARW